MKLEHVNSRLLYQSIGDLEKAMTNITGNPLILDLGLKGVWEEGKI
jgi:hypothetical protein